MEGLGLDWRESDAEVVKKDVHPVADFPEIRVSWVGLHPPVLLVPSWSPRTFNGHRRRKPSLVNVILNFQRRESLENSKKDVQ